VFVIKRFFVHRDLWDWLELLIVPAVLAASGLWFNRQQRERELGIATEQRERDIGLPRSDVGDAHTEHGPTFALQGAAGRQLELRSTGADTDGTPEA
jgi:hypothetical protein